MSLPRLVSETGTTWGGKSRSEDGEFSKSGILPDVVVAARKDLKSAQDERISELDRLIQAETTKISTVKQLIAVDLKAIETRIKKLETDLADIIAQIDAKRAEGIKLAEEISQVQADTVTRRDEGIRLRSKLKEIRADKVSSSRTEEATGRSAGTSNRKHRSSRAAESAIAEKAE